MFSCQIDLEVFILAAWGQSGPEFKDTELRSSGSTGSKLARLKNCWFPISSVKWNPERSINARPKRFRVVSTVQ